MYMNDGNKTKINLRNKSVFITGVVGFIVCTAVTKSTVPELGTLTLLIFVPFTLTELLFQNLFSPFALREILYI